MDMNTARMLLAELMTNGKRMSIDKAMESVDLLTDKEVQGNLNKRGYRYASSQYRWVNTRKSKFIR